MRYALCCALLWLAADARAEGWRSYARMPCPDVSSRTWLNTNGTRPTNASLRGKVWMLWFFGET